MIHGQATALTDAQFFWLLKDLGLGLQADEITVLCRRAPAKDGKIDWATFAPRCEELIAQTFRTVRDEKDIFWSFFFRVDRPNV